MPEITELITHDEEYDPVDNRFVAYCICFDNYFAPMRDKYGFIFIFAF